MRNFQHVQLKIFDIWQRCISRSEKAQTDHRWGQEIQISLRVWYREVIWDTEGQEQGTKWRECETCRKDLQLKKIHSISDEALSACLECSRLTETYEWDILIITFHFKRIQKRPEDAHRARFPRKAAIICVNFSHEFRSLINIFRRRNLIFRKCWKQHCNLTRTNKRH